MITASDIAAFLILALAVVIIAVVLAIVVRNLKPAIEMLLSFIKSTNKEYTTIPIIQSTLPISPKSILQKVQEIGWTLSQFTTQEYSCTYEFVSDEGILVITGTTSLIYSVIVKLDSELCNDTCRIEKTNAIRQLCANLYSIEADETIFVFNGDMTSVVTKIPEHSLEEFNKNPQVTTALNAIDKPGVYFIVSSPENWLKFAASVSSKLGKDLVQLSQTGRAIEDKIMFLPAPVLDDYTRYWLTTLKESKSYVLVCVSPNIPIPGSYTVIRIQDVVPPVFA